MVQEQQELINEIARQVERGDMSWPPLAKMVVPVPPPEPYPMWALGNLSLIAESLMVKASHRVNASTCATAALGAVNALAIGGFDVLWRDETLPIGLFLVSLASSSARKTTVYRAAFRGHRLADIEVDRIHTEAVKAYKQAEDIGEADRTVQPTPHAAYRIVNDTTIEALPIYLPKSNRAQMLVNDEAHNQWNNWSGSKKNRGTTMGAYNNLYSHGNAVIQRVNRPRIRIDNANIGQCMFGHHSKGLPHLFSEEAEDGYSARWLMAVDDAEYRTKWVQPASIEHSNQMLLEFRDLIMNVRERQDRQAHLVWDEPNRVSVSMTDTTEEEAFKFTVAMEDLEMQAKQNGLTHTATFYARATEHAIRLAANLAVYDYYAYHDELLITEAKLKQGIELVRWYGAEIARNEQRGAQSEKTVLADKTIQRMVQYMHEGVLTQKIDGVLHIKFNVAANKSGYFRADKEMLAEIRQLLIDNYQMRETKRGWFKIHPELLKRG